MLSLLGALAGLLLMLPFNGMQTGTSNAVTFSEVVFSLQITPMVAAAAVGFALIMDWSAVLLQPGTQPGRIFSPRCEVDL